MCVVDGTYVLGNFQDQSLTSLGNLDLEGVQNLGKLFIELNINDGTNNGGDFSSAECGSGGAVGTDTRWFSCVQYLRRKPNHPECQQTYSSR